MNKFFVLALFALIAIAIAKPARRCNAVCGADYTPVCARRETENGRLSTFQNQCVLTSYICEYGINYVLVGPGECIHPAV